MIRNKLFPWQMAQARRAMMVPILMPFQWWNIYWTTWSEVYRVIYSPQPSRSSRGARHLEVVV